MSFSQPFLLANLPKISSLNSKSACSFLKLPNSLQATTSTINIGVSGSSVSQYILDPSPKLVYNHAIPSTNNVTCVDVIERDEDQKEIWCFGLVANKNTASLNLITKGKDSEDNKKIALPSQAVGIKVFTKNIIVILASGLIQNYDMELQLLESLDSGYKASQVEFFNEDGTDFVFVLTDLKGKLSFKLYDIDLSSASVNVKANKVAVSFIREINSVILEEFNLAKAQVVYQFGKLYRMIGQEVDIYSLPHLSHTGKITLPFVNTTLETSIQPISKNRIIVTNGSTIYLVDLQHQAILTQFTLPPNIKSLEVLKTAVISGENVKNNNTFGIFVLKKKNHSELHMINVDVGTGTLKDAIGKSFIKTQIAAPIRSLDSDYEAEEPVTVNLSKLKKAKTTAQFDSLFFESLKIKKEYYTDADRFIMATQFGEILDLIWTREEFPNTLTYLLTHPLFPRSHTEGLLAKLNKDARLFKQAVVTCPNLPLDELLYALFTVENKEIVIDLSLRILQDFAKTDIKLGIKKLNKIDVLNFINTITSEDEEVKFKVQVFDLLALVIDSVGLFTLDNDTMEVLSQFIDDKLSIVNQNAELLNLLEVGGSSSIGVDIEESIPTYSVEYLEY